MRKRLQIECSTILSSTPIQSIIQSANTTTSSSSNNTDKLQSHSSKQQAYIQQCTYRISTPITAFKIHDPDPHAVDGGNVLGIRFEVMSQGQFLRPYYVMLNRPFAESPSHLRVHRHTVPPAIPLSGLAARHLPPPRTAASDPQDQQQQKQDLDRFVRALRREIMRFHNRLGVTADLRKTVGLQRRVQRESLTQNDVIEAGIADVEAKHVKITWADGRSGRVVMDNDGKVKKFVVFGPQGRDWDVAQRVFASKDSVDDIARKLRDYAATQ